MVLLLVRVIIVQFDFGMVDGLVGLFQGVDDMDPLLLHGELMGLHIKDHGPIEQTVFAPMEPPLLEGEIQGVLTFPMIIEPCLAQFEGMFVSVVVFEFHGLATEGASGPETLDAVSSPKGEIDPYSAQKNHLYPAFS